MNWEGVYKLEVLAIIINQDKYLELLLDVIWKRVIYYKNHECEGGVEKNPS